MRASQRTAQHALRLGVYVAGGARRPVRALAVGAQPRPRPGLLLLVIGIGVAAAAAAAVAALRLGFGELDKVQKLVLLVQAALVVRRRVVRLLLRRGVRVLACLSGGVCWLVWAGRRRRNSGR